MAAVMRLPDWEARLAALIEAVRDRPYQIGKWDCAQFCGAAVEAVLGDNPAAPFRGRYRNRRQGIRLLPGRRFKLRGFLTNLFGPPVAPLFLRRGDIAMMGTAIGVRWGAGLLFVGADAGADREGLVYRPVEDARCGWRVGA
jgi:hypothetical protein